MKGVPPQQTKAIEDPQDESEGSDDLEMLEEAYLKLRRQGRSKKDVETSAGSSRRGQPQEGNADEELSSASSESPRAPPSPSPDVGTEDEDASPPMHETLASSKGRVETKRRKHYVPEGETAEQRNARTIFVGNVSADIVKSKVRYPPHYGSSIKLNITQSAQKAFKRHILDLVGQATPLKPKIESIRYRSVAFKRPTSNLATGADDSATKTRKQDRAKTWKASNTDGKEDKPQEVVYLTSMEKKRIAFIKGELHESAGSMNAYIVFAHPAPQTGASTTLEALEATRLAVEHVSRSVFMGRTLRVDFVVKHEGDTGGDTRKPSHFEPQRSIFVGSLDYEAKEEDVLTFFDSLLLGEMGAPPAESGSSTSWVRGVRLVRDKDTRLGKGFGYVEFQVSWSSIS